jgi:hypothetical protein
MFQRKNYITLESCKYEAIQTKLQRKLLLMLQTI